MRFQESIAIIRLSVCLCRVDFIRFWSFGIILPTFGSDK